MFVLVFTLCDSVIAQTLPSYTQYLNNGFLINPAIAGSDGYTSFNTTYNKQLIGITNSPTTYSFSGQTRLLRRSYKIVNRNVKKNSVKPSTKGRVGLGAYALNDKSGQVNNTGVSLSYAYHIFLYRSQISFGISGQAFQYKIDQSKLEYGPDEDPVETEGLNLVTFVPNANLGFYWSGERHFLGFSANQLFNSVLNIGSAGLQKKLQLDRHYYLMGGYSFPINREFDLEASSLFKTTEQWMPVVDFSARLFYLSDYWAGLSYRTSGSIAVLFGVRVEQLSVGCAYDYSLNSLRKSSFGSAEIVASLKFGSNARRYRWINRY
jgi:type IX secretion system PorP/SprF family membrane protein